LPSKSARKAELYRYKISCYKMKCWTQCTDAQIVQALAQL